MNTKIWKRAANSRDRGATEKLVGTSGMRKGETQGLESGESPEMRALGRWPRDFGEIETEELGTRHQV